MAAVSGIAFDPLEAARAVSRFTILKPVERLQRIAQIIEAVDHRCLEADGPVTPTLQEMTQDEISRVYALATGHWESWKPKGR